MSVYHYLHTPLPDDSNEWRAISRLTRLMERHFGQDPHPYTLIFNICPDENLITFEGKRLPQLDVLLIGPKFVATIELKSCFEPVKADALEETWYGGDHKLMGGNAPNPFLQVRYARNIWFRYLAEQCAMRFPGIFAEEWLNRWEHLSVFLLFFPYLHPDSALPPLLTAGKWLTIRGLDDIAEIVFRTRSSRLIFAPATIQRLIKDILQARPWPEIARIRDDQIGDLFIYEPDQPLIRIPIHRYDDITIGRSSTQQVRINRHLRLISGAHARVEVQNGEVKVLDAGSKNGTYVNGRSIDSQQGVVLGEKEKALLGANSKKGIQIWYALHTMTTVNPQTLYGTLDTQVP